MNQVINLLIVLWVKMAYRLQEILNLKMQDLALSKVVHLLNNRKIYKFLIIITKIICKIIIIILM